MIDSKTRSGDYVNGSFAPYSVMQHLQHDVLAYPLFSTSFPGLSIFGAGSHADRKLKHQNQAKTAFLMFCQGFEGNYCRGMRYLSSSLQNSRWARKVNTFPTFYNLRALQRTVTIKVIISDIHGSTIAFLWINGCLEGCRLGGDAVFELWSAVDWVPAGI